MFFNNFETLNEHYGMNTSQTQFVIQDFYLKFEKMLENGECLWKKKQLDKKRIVWLNPNNGFYIAALKDLDYEMKLPNSLPTFKENLTLFKSVWMNLDYNLSLLYENIENHFATKEYCCLDCHFPFATVCTDLYSQFEPEPPPNHQ